MSRNLIARIAVAMVAIPAIIWIGYNGGIWLRSLVMLLAVLAGWEMLTRGGFSISTGWFWLGLGEIAALVMAGVRESGDRLIAESGYLLQVWIVIIIVILVGMFSAVGKRSPEELFRRNVNLVWGVMYLGLLYPFVYRVGMKVDIAPGGDLLLFLFALLWTGDTAAMAAGKAFGRHKLAPSVSPNKTVEGFIGHIAFCLLIAVLFSYWRLPMIGLNHLLIMAVGVSVFGQLGDLVESMWKRSLGIKDSSAIIPGHGGVLDRFDSLLFGAPFLYAYLRLFVA